MENIFRFMFENKFYDKERTRFVHMLDIQVTKSKWEIIMLPHNVIETARCVCSILQRDNLPYSHNTITLKY